MGLAPFDQELLEDDAAFPEQGDAEAGRPEGPPENFETVAALAKATRTPCGRSPSRGTSSGRFGPARRGHRP